MSDTPIKVQRLYQQVADRLMTAITKGNYEVGKRLPSERELAAKFNVSRPTIREAVIALELAGTVEVRNGSGVYVIEQAKNAMETSEMDIGPFELMEARRLFESETAALAATLITRDELDRLEQAVADMEQDNINRIDNHEASDRRFHVGIAQATQNSAIVATIENLWDVRNHSPMCVRILDKVRSQGVRPRIDEHRAIIEALRQRDAARSREAMRTHLSRVIEVLFKATETEAIQKARSEIEEKRNRFAKANF